MLITASSGWKTWKSKAAGCTCVVGDSDTVAMVMQPFDDWEFPLSCDALPIVIEVLPEQLQ